MDHLTRELAPLGQAAWAQVDEEARTRLRTYLAARRLVDFAGPFGWEHAALNLGRSVSAEPAPAEGIVARTRQLLPLVEMRIPFALDRRELERADRGDPAVDLGALDDAAKSIALAENTAIFHGYPAGGIHGVTEASSHEPIRVSGGWDAYPRFVASGVQRLLLSGVSGPYGLALGADAWTGVAESTEHGGYPLVEHLGHILGGPIVWAPGIQGGVVMSQRGGDFRLECGQDLSIGYLSHDADLVHLYLEESFTFVVLEPDAAIALVS